MAGEIIRELLKQTVDRVERENGRVNHPAAISGALGYERAEIYEHDDQKAGPHVTVEQTISFHCSTWCE
jgi:hypothetical protein